MTICEEWFIEMQFPGDSHWSIYQFEMPEERARREFAGALNRRPECYPGCQFRLVRKIILEEVVE